MVFTVENNAITAYEDVINRYLFTTYNLQKKAGYQSIIWEFLSG